MSHVHYDHIVNIDLFDPAPILVSKTDRNYAARAEDGYVPAAWIDLFNDRIRTMADGEYVLDGLRAVALPGHTPGNMGLLLEKERILLAGDAVKNAWEFVRGIPPAPVHSPAVALETYGRIKTLADIIVPGHDRPFRLDHDGKVHYTTHWSAEINVYPDPEQEVKVLTLP